MRYLVFPFVLCLAVIGCSLVVVKKIDVQTEIESSINADNEVLEQDSLIEWSENKKLRWDYFQGYPDTINFSGFGAVSYTVIPFENFNVYDDSIVIDLPCYFVVYKSWVVKPTNNLLNHEQGHFDITEIIARKMRRDISNYISTDNEATTKFYQLVSDKYYFKEKNMLNELYDKETDFSRNTEGQKHWDTKIAKMVKELEAYSSPHVVVKRK